MLFENNTLSKRNFNKPLCFHIKTMQKIIIDEINKKSYGGVTVSIVAFQAADSGSTPGHRKFELLEIFKIFL